MQEFRAKMQENGRVLIPAPCRKALHLSGGEEIVIYVIDGEARLFSLKHAVKEAQKMVKHYTKNHVNLTQELIDMRRQEAKNE